MAVIPDGKLVMGISSRALQAWDVRIDEAFFLGGVRKSDILKVFDASIFFDDQATHAAPASKLVPAAWVPYKK